MQRMSYMMFQKYCCCLLDVATLFEQQHDGSLGWQGIQAVIKKKNMPTKYFYFLGFCQVIPVFLVKS